MMTGRHGDRLEDWIASPVRTGKVSAGAELDSARAALVSAPGAAAASAAKVTAEVPAGYGPGHRTGLYNEGSGQTHTTYQAITPFLGHGRRGTGRSGRDRRTGRRA